MPNKFTHSAKIFKLQDVFQNRRSMKVETSRNFQEPSSSAAISNDGHLGRNTSKRQGIKLNTVHPVGISSLHTELHGNSLLHTRQKVYRLQRQKKSNWIPPICTFKLGPDGFISCIHASVLPHYKTQTYQALHYGVKAFRKPNNRYTKCLKFLLYICTHEWWPQKRVPLHSNIIFDSHASTGQ
jgi:hypothetical protein